MNIPCAINVLGIGKGTIIVNEVLNRCGQEGWELVSVVSGTSGMVFFFKRPLIHHTNDGTATVAEG